MEPKNNNSEKNSVDKASEIAKKDPMEESSNQKKATAKNIIICSDGTGNKGGKGQGTNVWRVYNSIDITDHAELGLRKQVTFYDDGVGTDENKYLKAFSGALGWGISRNIKEAYKFLCRNYQKGDGVYLFGFSRGAYTVRALGAFINRMGYLKEASSLTDIALDKKIDQLVSHYHSIRSSSKNAEPEVNSHDGKIKAICVWDTVAALGLPFDIGLRTIIQKFFFKFNFGDFKLSPKVENAFQALSIDDERATFHPLLWDESEESKEQKRISQVWFAGVHSNVGGGYPKQELSYVTLYWMLRKIGDPKGEKGVRFNQSFLPEVISNMNVHGKLYDSRAGLSSYYRFEPRNIENLCTERQVVPAIHSSVKERIDSRTDGYAPSNLVRFYLNKTTEADNDRRSGSNKTERDSNSSAHDRWSHLRMLVYFCFACVNLITVGFLLKLWAVKESGSLFEAVDYILFSIFIIIIFDKVKNLLAFRTNTQNYYPEFIRFRSRYSYLVMVVSSIFIYLTHLMSDFHFAEFSNKYMNKKNDLSDWVSSALSVLYHQYTGLVVTFVVVLFAILFARSLLKKYHKEIVQRLYYSKYP